MSWRFSSRRRSFSSASSSARSTLPSAWLTEPVKLEAAFWKGVVMVPTTPLTTLEKPSVMVARSIKAKSTINRQTNSLKIRLVKNSFTRLPPFLVWSPPQRLRPAFPFPKNNIRLPAPRFLRRAPTTGRFSAASPGGGSLLDVSD